VIVGQVDAVAVSQLEHVFAGQDRAAASGAEMARNPLAVQKVKITL
jgi:hypothetical protein